MKTVKVGPVGTRVDGVALSKIGNKQADDLRSLLYQEKVLIFPEQKLTVPHFLTFAKLLGTPIQFVDEEYHHPKHPDVFVVSNIVKNGRPFGMDKVGHYWHSDSSFLAHPQPVTMLHAQMVPKTGGETAFIDMGSVYEALDSKLKTKIEGKQAIHEGQWKYIISKKDLGLSIQEILERDRKEVPPVSHPMVVRHPMTKKKALYVNEGFTTSIVSMPKDESSSILTQLFSAIKNAESLYRHLWKVGDLVIWDNRSVVHRAYPPASTEKRMMFRIGIKDGPFFPVRSSDGTNRH